MSKPTISGRMIKCVCACADYGQRPDELRRRFTASTVRAVVSRGLVDGGVSGQMVATPAGQMVAATVRLLARLHPTNRENFIAEINAIL